MTPPSSTPPLIRLLQDMPELVPVGRIERVWVFPPRLTGEVESGLVVLALRAAEEPDSDLREVVTVEYEVRVGKAAAEPVREIVRRGWAPSERVPRMIAGVVRRLGGDEEEPHSESIDGDPELWAGFLEHVFATTVDPANE